MDFDPSEHTVDEVNDYIANHPGDTEAVLQAEREGKARKTLLEASRDAVFVTETGNLDARGGGSPAESGGMSNEDLERRGLRLPEVNS